MDELGNEQYKSEDEQAEKCVADNLAGNIAIKDAHGAKGECNMRGEAKEKYTAARPGERDAE
jgi:hypothetical protein